MKPFIIIAGLIVCAALLSACGRPVVHVSLPQTTPTAVAAASGPTDTPRPPRPTLVPQPIDPNVAEEMDQIEKEASGIRGLWPKWHTPEVFITREQFRQEL